MGEGAGGRTGKGVQREPVRSEGMREGTKIRREVWLLTHVRIVAHLLLGHD